MNRYLFERIKFFLLLTLIFTSLIQVGILWNYQYHSFPFSFLSAFFSSSSTSSSDINKEKASNFLLYKIIVTESGGESHWVVGGKSNLYNKMWEEAKNKYLKRIYLNKASMKTEEYSEYELQSRWGSLCATKPYVFEFAADIDSEIIRWFLDVGSGNSNGPPGIYKFIISPSDIDNNGNDTLYIMNQNKIFTYSVTNTDTTLFDLKDDNNFILQLSKDSSLQTFSYIAETFTGSNGSAFAKDILISSSDSSIYTLKMDVPEIGIKQSAYSPQELESLAGKVLKDEKNNYLPPGEDKDGVVVIKNMTSKYKITRDARLKYEYSNLTGEGDKGNMKDAFLKALEFIDVKKRNILSEVNLYLSDVSVTNDPKSCYKFSFNYYIENNKDTEKIPVTFSSNGNSNERVNAIEIKANSQRVLGCDWILRNFTTEDKPKYKSRFASQTDALESEHSELKKYFGSGDVKDILIKDLFICYNLKENTTGAKLGPSVAVRDKGGLYYFASLKKK